MSAWSVALIVMAWGLVALSVIGLLRKWNAPLSDRSYEKPLWFAWGELWWTGYRRGVLPAALVIVSFALALTLPSSVGAPVGLAAFVIFFPLWMSVQLFNWPKALVPPACRSQEGIVRSVRQRRAKGKGS